MLVLALIVAAFVCFLLAAFQSVAVPAPRVNLIALGLAFIAAAMAVPLIS